MQALGMISWPLVLIPVAIAALLAGALTADVDWWLLVPVVLVALLIHLGTSLLATYTGFRRSMARTTALGTNRLLHDGLLSTPQVWAAGLLCIAFGCFIGLLVVGFRGPPLLLVGVGGVVAGLVYAGWPLQLSLPWFEAAAVFLGTGPLLVLGTTFALTGSVSLLPVLVSVMLGCLVECILFASHLQAPSAAIGPRVRSLPQALGWERARWVFYGLLGLPYALLGVLILGEALPVWAWVTFLSLALVARHLIALWQAAADQTQALAGFDHRMAQTYMAFGGWLIVSLMLGS
jgi:1,4-dihydroxy-2-naphthoate octaprenyltransferase